MPGVWPARMFRCKLAVTRAGKPDSRGRPKGGAMSTRRDILKCSFAAGVGVALATPTWRAARGQTSTSQLERNKAVVRRFKESQGTKDEAEALREVLAPNYKRWRAGFEHIGANARDQGFPGPGSYLRGAFPDRTDTIEAVVAEGDRVGMLFKVRGTHKGQFLRHRTDRQSDRRLRARHLPAGRRADHRSLVPRRRPRAFDAAWRQAAAA